MLAHLPLGSTQREYVEDISRSRGSRLAALALCFQCNLGGIPVLTAAERISLILAAEQPNWMEAIRDNANSNNANQRQSAKLQTQLRKYLSDQNAHTSGPVRLRLDHSMHISLAHDARLLLWAAFTTADDAKLL